MNFAIQGYGFPGSGFAVGFGGYSSSPDVMDWSRNFLYGAAQSLPSSPSEAGMGFYYNFGDSSGAGFSRTPGMTGPWAWNRGDASLYRGAHAAGALAGSMDLSGGNINRIFDNAAARYDDYTREMQSRREGERGENLDAPENLADRADDYFTDMVENGEKTPKSYGSAAKRAIREMDKDAAQADPDTEGRDSSLQAMARRTASWMNGDNSEMKRGEFLEQVNAQTDPSHEDMLLALVSPGSETPSEIPNSIAQKLMQDLGENRTPSDATSEKVFRAYVEMLQSRFGDDFEAIVESYYKRAIEVANSKGIGDVSKPTVAEITARGYVGKEAKDIAAILAKHKPFKARRLFDDLPDVNSIPDDASERHKKFSGWYIKYVKGVSDEDETNKLYRAGLKKGKKDFEKFAQAVDKAMGKKGGIAAGTGGGSSSAAARRAGGSGRTRGAGASLTPEQQLAAVRQLITRNPRSAYDADTRTLTLVVNTPILEAQKSSYRAQILSQYPDVVTIVNLIDAPAPAAASPAAPMATSSSPSLLERGLGWLASHADPAAVDTLMSGASAAVPPAEDGAMMFSPMTLDGDPAGPVPATPDIDTE